MENELRQSRLESAGARLRELSGLAYIQASQRNFGLAAETSSRFFAQARGLASRAQDVTSRKAIEDLLTTRNRVTAELAKGDAALLGDLQELFVKTGQATASLIKL